MTDLKTQIQIVLNRAAYVTWFGSVDGVDTLGFEDDTVMGFVYIFPDVMSLLTQWHAAETRMLRNYAASLQKAGEKTWNVYSVFLTAAASDETQAREVRWIEEDLERTRKIAACRITDQQSLVTTLLPLLPIQNQPVLDRDDFDVTKRLQKRISTIAQSVGEEALNEKTSAAEIVRMLGVDA